MLSAEPNVGVRSNIEKDRSICSYAHKYIMREEVLTHGLVWAFAGVSRVVLDAFSYPCFL